MTPSLKSMATAISGAATQASHVDFVRSHSSRVPVASLLNLKPSAKHPLSVLLLLSANRSFVEAKQKHSYLQSFPEFLIPFRAIERLSLRCLPLPRRWTYHDTTRTLPRLHLRSYLRPTPQPPTRPICRESHQKRQQGIRRQGSRR